MKPLFSWQFQEDDLIDGAAISIWDRGFRYGMSIFETILIHRGRAVFLEEHLRRLRDAAGAAGFSVSSKFIAVLRSRLSGFDESLSGMMRIYVTAGDGGPLSDGEDSRVYVLGEDVALPDEIERGCGWRLHVSRAPLVSILGGWKTGNYWPHVQALAEARHHGCNESIMLDLAGNVVSASMANLFAVIDGELKTPPLVLGARDGVLREWVMNNTSAREDLVALDDLMRATECFITNSRVGILSVGEIDGRELSSRSTSCHLYDTYREKVLAS